MKYRQWSRQITDEQFLRRTKAKIEELERKLREIDEEGRAIAGKCEFSSKQHLTVTSLPISR